MSSLKLYEDYLPPLPESMGNLVCSGIESSYFPPFPENCKNLVCSWNELTNEEIILNNFRYLYYSLKFKKKFKDWLWIKVREPKIEKNTILIIY